MIKQYVLNENEFKKIIEILDNISSNSARIFREAEDKNKKISDLAYIIFDDAEAVLNMLKK